LKWPIFVAEKEHKSNFDEVGLSHDKRLKQNKMLLRTSIQLRVSGLENESALTSAHFGSTLFANASPFRRAFRRKNVGATWEQNLLFLTLIRKAKSQKNKAGHSLD